MVSNGSIVNHGQTDTIIQINLVTFHTIEMVMDQVNAINNWIFIALLLEMQYYIYFQKETITTSTTTKPLYPTLYPKYQPFAPVPSAVPSYVPPHQDGNQRPGMKPMIFSWEKFSRFEMNMWKIGTCVYFQVYFHWLICKCVSRGKERNVAIFMMHFLSFNNLCYIHVNPFFRHICTSIHICRSYLYDVKKTKKHDEKFKICVIFSAESLSTEASKVHALFVDDTALDSLYIFIK